jgi:hypothetical protein
VVQFVAYTDGKLEEVAYDYYAQADDGSVYYLGEDVSNYTNGQIDHEGSWRAGKDGAPPALIMPAHPQVGQKFNPENLPGVVYETDEVLSLSDKVITPGGEINDGIRVKETLMDGTIEHKVYAANYGIVLDQGGGEELKLVLLVRTAEKPGVVPEALSTIEMQAEDIFDVTPGGQWEMVSADVAAIGQAWQAFQAQAANHPVPQPFQDALAAAYESLQQAAASRDISGTLQAANDLSAGVVDLYTLYHPATPVDLGRLDVLERQVGRDIAANDRQAAADTLAKTNTVWVRIKPVILAHQGADMAKQFEKSLAAQQASLEKGDTSTVENESHSSLELIDALERLF